MNIDALVYHNYCSDGTACKWIVSQMNDISLFVPVNTGANHLIDLDQFRNKVVMFVDLSIKQKQLEYLETICKGVIIIDHHDYSYDEYKIYDVGGYINVISIFTDDINFNSVTRNKHMKKNNCCYKRILINKNFAACQLVWQFTHGNTNCPWFINYIADRDMYMFLLPNSKEINMSIYSLQLINELGFESMMQYTKNQIKKLVDKGKELLDNKAKEIQPYVLGARKATIETSFGTLNTWISTCPRHLRSDIGNELCLKTDGNFVPDFGTIYCNDPNSNDIWMSLRGIGKVNLDKLCQELDENGKGHFDAAGFTIYDNSLESVFTFV